MMMMVTCMSAEKFDNQVQVLPVTSPVTELCYHQGEWWNDVQGCQFHWAKCQAVETEVNTIV